MKPLAHRIAEFGLVLEAALGHKWRVTEAHALGSAFTGHALKRLHLLGTTPYSGGSFRYTTVEEGFLPALTAALPALESLSLSYIKIPNGEPQLCSTALPA
jgi:hypothetical protein